MLLFLIRHGETNYNIQHRFQGMHGVSRLTETGKAQARELSSLLAPLTFDRVLCSTALRARETLSLAMPGLSEDEVLFLDEAREVDVGCVTDMLVKDAKEQFSHIFAAQPDGMMDYSALGGESPEDVLSRAKQIIRLVKELGQERVALVTHGAFLCYMIAAATGIEPLHRKAPASNCSVSVVELTEEKGVLRLYNLTADGLNRYFTSAPQN